MKIGDVTSSYISRLVDAAVQQGIDQQEILQRHNLDPQKINDPNERFDLTLLMKLGAWIINRTNDPTLGLKLGSSAQITRMGIPGLTAMCSKTLGDAFAVVADYETITSRCYRGQSSIDESPNNPAIRFYSIAPYNQYTMFVVDMVLIGWNSTITWLTNRDDLVLEAHFEFSPPEYVSHYSEFFNAPVKFDQPCNQLLLKEDCLATPVIYHDQSTLENLLELCEQKLKKLSKKETFADKVQQVLGPMLHGRPPSIEETATQLAIPTWTLRRKLKEEGISFQNLLDDMRKELALGYMQDTELSFGEIAYILGFSTPGAFQRAFKRWTNSTPGAYRKAILDQENS